MNAPTRRALLGGVPLAVLVVGAAPVGFAEHPDAVVIRTCESVSDALGTYAADENADFGEAGAFYDAVVDAIDAVRPQTLDGVVAKAKAAIFHASETPGLDVVKGERSSVAEGWAWDLLHDLLRLHGAQGRAEP